MEGRAKGSGTPSISAACCWYRTCLKKKRGLRCVPYGQWAMPVMAPHHGNLFLTASGSREGGRGTWGKRACRWASALTAPRYAVRDMQPRVLCINMSRNQGFLCSWFKGELVCLKAYLSGHLFFTSSYYKRGTVPKKLCLPYFGHATQI